jgi:dynein assembly factor 2
MRGRKPADIQMTREEYKKIKQSMKDEKFHELLGDYMKEISDPKNVAEYDQYLEQLKSEGELPEGMDLLRPNPEFVVKSNLASRTDKKYTQNIFINVCSHAAVGLPETKTTPDGQKHWHVPYFVGKIRYDQADAETVVNTVDVVFNKESIDLARKNKEYHRLVCETAIEGAQASLAERKEIVNRDYTLVPNMTCKGDQPALLPVTLDAAARERNKQARLKHPGGKAYAEIEEIKEKQKKDKKDEEEAAKLTGKEDEMEEPEPVPAEPDFSRGPIAPKYSLVYSYPVDIGNFTNSSDIYQPVKKESPSHISLKIELPKVEDSQSLSADIKPTKFQLAYKELYFLDINFMFEVDPDKAKAKFISAKRVLDLTLPIVKRIDTFQPPARPAPPPEDTEEVSDKPAAQSPEKPSAGAISGEKVASKVLKEAEDASELSLNKAKRPLIEELQPQDPSSTTPDPANRTSPQPDVALPDQIIKQQSLEAPTSVYPTQVSIYPSLTIYLYHLPSLFSSPPTVSTLSNATLTVIAFNENNGQRRYTVIRHEGERTVEIVGLKDYVSVKISRQDKGEEGKCGGGESDGRIDESLGHEELTELVKKMEEEHAVKQEELKNSRVVVPLQSTEVTPVTTETQAPAEPKIDMQQGEFSETTNLTASEKLSSPDNKEESTVSIAPAPKASNYGPQLIDLLVLDLAMELD